MDFISNENGLFRCRSPSFEYVGQFDSKLIHSLTLPIEHCISTLNGNLNRYMMINFEVIDAGMSGLRVIYISVLGKKLSYWNSQAKRRVINCGNRIGNWKRLGGIVTEGCKSVSTIFPLIRIQYEAECKTPGFKVMLDIFIPKGFFVEAVLLNKVYFMFKV